MTPAAKREAVAHLVGAYEMSERRACRLIKADRKTVRYRSRRPRDEGIPLPKGAPRKRDDRR